jgi:hypothetical protein
MILGELQTRQIAALHADGMTIEQISSSLDLAPELVKLAVARNSNDGDRDITEEDLRRLRSHAVALALGADNEGVQARMTQWLIERDKPKVSANVSPVLMINQALVAMQQNYGDLLKSYET